MNRAQTYMKEIKHIENYTHYKGLKIVRDNIARFITNRDASEANSNDIFISNGASGGIKAILQILCGDKEDAIMTPIPQYPLYSASIELLGSTLVGYYLDEANQWSVDIKSLHEQYKKYHDSGHKVKALVVINPGNPTGNILSEDNIKDIIKFCHEHNMIILADEVYQNNIYSESKKFHSFRKVLSKLLSPYNKTTLFSFNSISKGYYGE
jgi:alanine transaminase